MAHELRRRNVSSAIEKRILTALIVSTQFNYEVDHLINFDYFTNSFIRTVAKWCVDFFDTYEQAPFDHIQDIFEGRKPELKEEDVDLIKTLLEDISKKYELNSGLNIEYSVAQALKFFKLRQLQITSSNIDILLSKNDIDAAEEQINNYTKIAKITSGWVNPFDEDHIKTVFRHTQRMFNFPGALGKFLGGMDRGWLAAIAAPFKKGKSWNVQEIGVLGIQQKLKVASFSLEMGTNESNDRFYKRLLGAGDPEGGPATYPCFDCAHNQDGSCKKGERTNKITLLISNGKPKFDPAMEYTPCTACRFVEPYSYRVAWWFEQINRPAYTEEGVKRHLSALRNTMDRLYRFKAYPKFSANTNDIRRDLDILERGEGFVPDIILIDQANGLKSEAKNPTGGVEQIDDTWKNLARLGGERNALIVSPSQVTRSALDKKNVRQGDVAQWIGLLGHIDVGFSLNQTDEEKKAGIMRYSKMIHRHDDFMETESCIVLQKLDFGQVCLDAHILT